MRRHGAGEQSAQDCRTRHDSLFEFWPLALAREVCVSDTQPEIKRGATPCLLFEEAPNTERASKRFLSYMR